jgi:hypothetical protein
VLAEGYSPRFSQITIHGGPNGPVFINLCQVGSPFCITP